MREGGHLAQYATPAELLMAPADGFVEDFVGADRALKRLALMRVSDIDLWQAPLARRAVRPGAGGASTAPRSQCARHRLRAAPIGWMSDADLARRRSRRARYLRPGLELDDAARCPPDLLAETRTPRSTPRADRGVLGRDHLEF
jgi:osmoprotectant transport system ATP-binding protein